MLRSASRMRSPRRSAGASLLGCAAAAANVAGGLVVIARRPWNEILLKYFVALGAGFMLAATFLRMLPESFAALPACAPLRSSPAISSCTSSSTRSLPISISARRFTTT